MSLLLTRNVNQYCIDLCRSLLCRVGMNSLDSALLEPFADEVAVETITLHDQHASHGPIP